MLAGMADSFDAVVLIAHGARDARWVAPFHRLRDELSAALSPLPIALSFLDFVSPPFSEAVADLHAKGARRLLVAPLFLSGGGHVANDVPELVRAAQARHPTLEFEVAGAIGEEPEVASAMAKAVARLVRR
jgi:sirohydrochlorin cobaltochelatase